MLSPSVLLVLGVWLIGMPCIFGVLSIARSSLAAAGVGNYVVFGGGTAASGISSNVVDICDVTSKQWLTQTTLSVPRYSLTAAGAGDLVLFGGGYSTSYSNVVDIYNITSKNWLTPTTLSVSRRNLASVATNDLVFFGGGICGINNYSNVVDIYNVTSKQWLAPTTLSIARYDLVAAGAGDLVFFGGGYYGYGNYSNVVDIYNITSRQWLTPITLSVGRYEFIAVGIKDLILFGGGNTGSGLSDVVDIYNVTSKQWLTSTNLSVPRSRLAAVAAGNFVLFGGGYAGVSSGVSNVLDIYDVSLMQWLTPTNLSQARQGLVAAGARDVVLFGGGSGSSTGPSNVVDIYDYTPSLSTPIPTPSSTVTETSTLTPISTIPSPPTNTSNTVENITSSDLGIILGSISAVILVIAIIVGLLIFWLRRRNFRNSFVFDDGQLPLSYNRYLTMITDKKDCSINLVYPNSNEYLLGISLLQQLDGSRLVNSVQRIYSVLNGTFATNFMNHVQTIQRRHQTDPNLFVKTDWIQKEDRVELRSWVAQTFGSHFLRYPWNKFGGSCPVLPMIHGTSATVARKIVQNGFTTLSTLDAGFYGSGMYFTSSALYSLPYYANKPDPAVLLCLVVPGNPYPVVEHKTEKNSYLGKPIKSGYHPLWGWKPAHRRWCGYQCHYVLTTKDGNPCLTTMEAGTYYDELVIGQEAQVVPVFLIEFDQSKLIELAVSFQRTIVE